MLYVISKRKNNSIFNGLICDSWRSTSCCWKHASWTITLFTAHFLSAPSTPSRYILILSNWFLFMKKNGCFQFFTILRYCRQLWKFYEIREFLIQFHCLCHFLLLRINLYRRLLHDIHNNPNRGYILWMFISVRNLLVRGLTLSRIIYQEIISNILYRMSLWNRKIVIEKSDFLCAKVKRKYFFKEICFRKDWLWKSNNQWHTYVFNSFQQWLLIYKRVQKILFSKTI